MAMWLEADSDVKRHRGNPLVKPGNQRAHTTIAQNLIHANFALITKATRSSENRDRSRRITNYATFTSFSPDKDKPRVAKK